MITQITTHVEDGLARLIEQYKNATLFKLWITTYLKRLQAVEDALWEVLTERSLDASVGVQLDIIGKIVNRARGTLDDDNYRIALRAEILILRSDGRGNDIIGVAALGLPSGYTFGLRDLGVATILFTIHEPVAFDPLVLFHMLVRTKAGGVKFLFEFHTLATLSYFIWKANSSSATVGFGDSVSGTGGLLSCVLAG